MVTTLFLQKIGIIEEMVSKEKKAIFLRFIKNTLP
jgi:hypothetical protein